MAWCKLVLKEGSMARENYSYKKFQKELARKKKAEAKQQRRLEKKALASAPEAGPVLDPSPADPI
jgi:hypothetical protein